MIFALTIPALMQGSVAGARVVLLDWDIQSLAQGGVAPWLTNVRERTMTWFHRLKPLRGLPQAHIEPAGNGYAIIEAARAQGFNPHEIDAKYVTLGKDGRALAVEPHATDGRVAADQSAPVPLMLAPLRCRFAKRPAGQRKAARAGAPAGRAICRM